MNAELTAVASTMRSPMSVEQFTTVERLVAQLISESRFATAERVELQATSGDKADFYRHHGGRIRVFVSDVPLDQCDIIKAVIKQTFETKDDVGYILLPVADVTFVPHAARECVEVIVHIDDARLNQTQPLPTCETM